MSEVKGLAELCAKGVVIFSPASYNIDASGDCTITCSLGNTYRVNHENAQFISKFREIVADAHNDVCSICCTLDDNGVLDCFVM